MPESICFECGKSVDRASFAVCETCKNQFKHGTDRVQLDGFGWMTLNAIAEKLAKGRISEETTVRLEETSVKLFQHPRTAPLFIKETRLNSLRAQKDADYNAVIGRHRKHKRSRALLTLLVAVVISATSWMGYQNKWFIIAKDPFIVMEADLPEPPSSLMSQIKQDLEQQPLLSAYDPTNASISERAQQRSRLAHILDKSPYQADTLRDYLQVLLHTPGKVNAGLPQWLDWLGEVSPATDLTKAQAWMTFRFGPLEQFDKALSRCTECEVLQGFHSGKAPQNTLGLTLLLDQGLNGSGLLNLPRLIASSVEIIPDHPITLALQAQHAINLRDWNRSAEHLELLVSRCRDLSIPLCNSARIEQWLYRSARLSKHSYSSPITKTASPELAAMFIDAEQWKDVLALKLDDSDASSMLRAHAYLKLENRGAARKEMSTIQAVDLGPTQKLYAAWIWLLAEQPKSAQSVLPLFHDGAPEYSLLQSWIALRLGDPDALRAHLTNLYFTDIPLIWNRHHLNSWVPILSLPADFASENSPIALRRLLSFAEKENSVKNIAVEDLPPKLQRLYHIQHALLNGSKEQLSVAEEHIAKLISSDPEQRIVFFWDALVTQMRLPGQSKLGTPATEIMSNHRSFQRLHKLITPQKSNEKLIGLPEIDADLLLSDYKSTIRFLEQ